MLHQVHQAALALHILGGAVALFLFWVPMLSRKGGVLHRRSGRWYYWAMMVVAFSALVLSSVIMFDPVATKERIFSEPEAEAEFVTGARLFALFLAQLAVMLYSNLHFGTWVLKVRANRQQLRRLRHLWQLPVLLVLALSSGILGLQQGAVLLIIFAPLGIFTVVTSLHYVYTAVIPARGWQAAHVRNIIPSGIAAYTAFFVVGASSWFGDSSWRLIPWVAPTVLGSLAIVYYSRQVLRNNGPDTDAKNQLLKSPDHATIS